MERSGGGGVLLDIIVVSLGKPVRVLFQLSKTFYLTPVARKHIALKGFLQLSPITSGISAGDKSKYPKQSEIMSRTRSSLCVRGCVLTCRDDSPVPCKQQAALGGDDRARGTLASPLCHRGPGLLRVCA